MPTTSRTRLRGSAKQDEQFGEPPLKISGDAGRYNHGDGNDDYRQVTALFNLFDAGQKQRLFSNFAEAMWGIPKEIAERQLGQFSKVHPDYGAGVRSRSRNNDAREGVGNRPAAEDAARGSGSRVTGP